METKEIKLLSTREAREFCAARGTAITERAIRKACARGHIPNAIKIGGVWLVSRIGLLYYMHDRPKRGPRPMRAR